MKDIKVGNTIEVKISKITQGKDENIYVTVESPIFDNKPTFIIRKDKFVWKSETGRITIK
ncbi:MAG: hypothetical protein PHP08_00580 [Candidatus Dojkabacteria bacterium]|nr:hypothetical protein [Candidatus Dojkabacteria bacterium]